MRLTVQPGTTSPRKVSLVTKLGIMADLEVATKAPESDGAEENAGSIIPGDTPAQSGASLGVS